MNQEAIFKREEGDRWYLRNQNVLVDGSRAIHDPVLELIRGLKKKPKHVLEAGCSNGWRLAELDRLLHCRCFGVDVSRKAITDGRRIWPRLKLKHAPLSHLPFDDAAFDLIIAPFVLHWVDRSLLFRSLAELDRVLVPGGHLIISDFLPDEPEKVSYHHRPEDDVFTYVQDYAGLMSTSALYRTQKRIMFDGTDPAHRKAINTFHRACATLLTKNETYRTVRYQPSVIRHT